MALAIREMRSSALAAGSPSPWSTHYAANQSAANDEEIFIAAAEEIQSDASVLADVGLNADGTLIGGGKLALALSLYNQDQAKFDSEVQDDTTDADSNAAAFIADAAASYDDAGPQIPPLENAAGGTPSASVLTGTAIGSLFSNASDIVGLATSIVNAGLNVVHYFVGSHAEMGDAADDAPSIGSSMGPSDAPQAAAPAASHGPEDLAGGKDPLIVLARAGNLLDEDDPNSADNYAAIAAYQLTSGPEKYLPLDSTPVDERVIEGERRFRKMLGLPEPAKPPEVTGPAQKPGQYTIETNYGPLTIRERPEPRQYTDAELDAPRNRKMLKLATKEVRDWIAAGRRIPMTERHIVATRPDGTTKTQTVSANVDPKVLAERLWGLNKDGYSTKLVAHDPTKPGANTDLVPITTREFFQGSTAEFQLAVIKHYKDLKLAERDPLGSENINEVLDTLQIGLDILGLIAVIGEGFDAASGIVSAGRGDMLGASLSLAAMIPLAGGTAGAAKTARHAADAIETAADAVKVTADAAALAQQVRAIANVEQTVAQASNQALKNIDDALRAGYVTEQQLVETMVREFKLSEEQARGVINQAEQVGKKTREGTNVIPQYVTSHDVGVQLGRKYATEELNLKEVGWVNPDQLERRGKFGNGFDDVMQDELGNYVIVEYKGNGGKLDGRQMTEDWVEDNLKLLRDSDSPWFKTLSDAKAQGRLRGIALRSTEGPNGFTQVIFDRRYKP